MKKFTLAFVVAVLGLSTVQSSTETDNLKFYVYSRLNPVQAEVVEPNVESVLRNIFNPLKPTTIAIHRWQGSKDSPENREIVSAKLQKENCNVVVVDWSLIAPDVYLEAVGNTTTIGAAIADFVILLHRHFDVKFSQIHVVGFSLGAQIAGATGQSIYERTQQKVQHITALDPAGPGFSAFGNDNSNRLSPEDAHFVEVIHTNAGELGYEAPCGHADYYPNGGILQPNCKAADMMCSHERAYELVREMWSQDNDFLSAKCVSTEYLSTQDCIWLSNIKMGQNLHESGLYYLETKGIYPYSKGSFAFLFL